MQVDFTSSGLLYEYYTPMLATSVKPLYATTAGGTLITISGCEPHLSGTFVSLTIWVCGPTPSIAHYPTRLATRVSFGLFFFAVLRDQFCTT